MATGGSAALSGPAEDAGAASSSTPSPPSSRDFARRAGVVCLGRAASAEQSVNNVARVLRA
eukprot:13598367-Alexandrium_andersonii.AAC.1